VYDVQAFEAAIRVLREERRMRHKVAMQMLSLGDNRRDNGRGQEARQERGMDGEATCRESGESEEMGKWARSSIRLQATRAKEAELRCRDWEA
jgi:hypothetical protein